MFKAKPQTGNRLLRFFRHHPWLKVITLILAFIFWFYVKGVIVIPNN